MKKRYYIETDGEDTSFAYRDLTEKEYNLMKGIFDEMNANKPKYAPVMKIELAAYWQQT